MFTWNENVAICIIPFIGDPRLFISWTWSQKAIIYWLTELGEDEEDEKDVGMKK
jgi:hypothetical protein